MLLEWMLRTKATGALPAVHGLDVSASFACEGNWNMYSGKRSLLRDSMVLTCSLGGEWCHHGSVLVPSC